MVVALGEEVARLVARVRALSPDRLRSRAGGSGGQSTAEVIQALADHLVALGRRAGSGAPAAAVLPEVGVHALADLLAVVAHDLLTAPGVAEVAAEGRRALRQARDQLER